MCAYNKALFPEKVDIFPEKVDIFPEIVDIATENHHPKLG